MAERLVIERLEFQGHIGVTPDERDETQPIGVDVELDYPAGSLDAAAAAEDLSRTVDYARVAERLVEVGTSRAYHLMETLAEGLTGMLFAEFPISGVCLWVRKMAPPVNAVHGSVGVRVERTRASHLTRIEPRPAHFLVEQLHRLPRGQALDVAAGTGRNALYLAAHGYPVDAIDRDDEALARLAGTALQRNQTNLTTRCVDLEADLDLTTELPKERYDVILVFSYLHRPLFPCLLQALRPGGMLVYETFLIENHLRHQHPRRREFCLTHNELLRLTTGLRVLHYDEGEHEDVHGGEGAFTARLLATKE
ncbi:MAG: dihydroneopterin aldolase [Nitrospiraceae bacterium]